MDSVFQLSNGDRAHYLINLMHSFGCSYICLWTYSLDHNFLYCEYGYYHPETPSEVGTSSSSSTSPPRRHFEEYKNSVFPIENDSLLPGLAFKRKNRYLEIQEFDLQRRASNQSQREFYQEARIKIALFLACQKGEIELGMSHIPQMNVETKMQTLFPEDFARQVQQSSSVIAMEIPRITDQNWPSSSSSMDSPEYSSLLYSMPSSSSYLQEQLHKIPFPSPESTDAALTRAYLAILSSPSSSSTSQQTSTQQPALPHGYQMSQRPSAFRTYGAGLGPSSREMRFNLRRQTMLKRAIAYFRRLNYRRMQEEVTLPGSTRPTSTQLHHMISERRRREKINESFQALRSLLPQGTKKDKASVLRTTKEYLNSLKTQLEELSRRNQLLEAQLPTKNKGATPQKVDHEPPSDEERLNVCTMPVSESTSTGERRVDLCIMLRGEYPAADLIIRVLEFLKTVREASLVSMEAHETRPHEGADQSPTNWMTFRMRIEEPEWNESNFKEAVKRMLADFGH